MPSSTRFKKGDVVVHTRRPEWGRGVVDQATAIKHEGQDAQRLVIQFTNHGRVTVNTAVALLANKGSEVGMTHTTGSASFSSSSSNQGWLGALESNPNELWALPEAMTDPFVSLGSRLKATLESYRFSTEARSLIDWAVAQTGLADPLSKYNRHELEQAFARFERDRGLHLNSLVGEIKKKGRGDLLDQQMNEPHRAEAKNALKKAIRR